jgi:hypothetical protein
MEIKRVQKSQDYKEIYECLICQYKTVNKFDYKKHENTEKHKFKILEVFRKYLEIKNSGFIENYQENFVDTAKKSQDWNGHDLKQKSQDDKLQKTVKDSKNICDICSKTYKNASGLWKHKKKCKTIIEQKEEPNTNIICELIKQNQEFKTLLVEQNNKLKEYAKEGKNKTNNTTNNHQFNLKVF